MVETFFERPILNSPYAYPGRHWELDADGQPTNRIIETRRRSEFITPVPKPKKRRRAPGQAEMRLRRGRRAFDRRAGIRPDPDHQRDPRLRRRLAEPAEPEPVAGHARDRPAAPALAASPVQRHPAVLLPDRGGRDGDLADRGRAATRQARASESWTTSTAPTSEANPELLRLALKLATGAGKTTVMAMLIAWQTVNAVRRPGSKHFTRGFLVVTPGITIRDRLRVLQPNDPDSYYAQPRAGAGDMLDDIERAKIVITNYHAFKLRERIELSKGGRALLQGRGDGAEHARDRRPDAPARHARPDGPEEHPRAQRRGAPLLPREAAGRGRRGPEGRRQEGSREEQRGGAPLDLRPRGRQAQARRRARLSTSPRRRSSCAARATPKARCSRGR